jgi:hypothetical protein
MKGTKSSAISVAPGRVQTKGRELEGGPGAERLRALFPHEPGARSAMLVAMVRG